MDFLTKLKNEKRQIEKVINSARAKLATLSPGRIKTTTKDGGQYYIYSEEEKKWKYMRKNDLTRVKEIAQYDYEKSVLSQSEKQLSILSRFINNYNPGYLASLQKGIPDARKKLLDLHILSDDEFIAKWKSKPYISNGFKIENGFITQNGELVRSKSEAIIADRLKFLGIPYRYEYPIKLDDGFVYPDFLLLDITTRSEILYEHFGRMDDENYVNNNFLAKISRYARNGYFVGQNLIVSYESSTHPLNIKDFEINLRTVMPKTHAK